MKKIMTKKVILENELAKSVKCNASKPSEHCLKQCHHGRPHIQDTGADSCAKPQFCSLSKAGIIKVKCKKLTKKEIKEILNES